MEGPLLWYLNRGSGAVLLVLLTLTVVLGVLSLGGLPARRVPRFVFQLLHRNVGSARVRDARAHIVSAVRRRVRRHPLVAGVRAGRRDVRAPVAGRSGAVAVDLLW